jgi:hypothetical protein
MTNVAGFDDFWLTLSAVDECRAIVPTVVKQLGQLFYFSYLFSRMQQQDEPGPEAGGKTRNPNFAAS